ncbi:MAG: filamentous hemagglutinin N-terminal domain-containing protein [Candidatus Gastranaerophilales bacterium]|nr:filamentous hemagglutinin N-terminal domain-containing protein [Candidatus Gastranaerophilales bacterium]
MKKLLSSTIAVGIFASMSVSPVFADVSANTLPSYNSSTNSVITTPSDNYMNVQTTGGQGSLGTVNWNSYNIGSDATVNYEFTAHNQTSLNLVSASGGMSQIYGNITNSGCSGCGYADTGKVILINPNGVLFGGSANVNLNSFTVSTLDGTYDEENNKLILQKGSNQSDNGIIVMDGANIYGDKNVTFASNNITQYAGSKISTNTAANVGDDSYGKVKLVTADGVNFTYYNNGAVKNVTDATASSDKMLISLNGAIESGHIDVRNYSTDSDSEINLNGATLKATKAVSGNDGNIWLTASNKIVMEDSTLESVSNGTASGNIVIKAGEKVSVGSSTLTTENGNITLTSSNGDVVVDDSTLNTSGDVTLTAGGIASIQQGSIVNGANVKLNGTDRAQIYGSDVTAENVDMNAENIWLYKANVNASDSINAEATSGYVLAQDSSLTAGDKGAITLTAAGDLTAEGLDVNDSQTNLYAGNDINAELANVGNRAKGLVAEAENNVTITTDGTLSVSRLVAKNGDMTLNADKVIAGLPYTTEEKISGDDSERSYIYVANGTFTSNTTNDSYEVTASDTIVDDNYQLRHHIQYGNGDEKILLINKRPYTAPVTPSVEPVAENNTSIVIVDEDQSQMLNKLPRQPETYNNNTNIQDTRTSLIDVFAAASQIEIEEDEE